MQPANRVLQVSNTETLRPPRRALFQKLGRTIVFRRRLRHRFSYGRVRAGADLSNPDLAIRKPDAAPVKVAVFSAHPYVVDFLQPHLDRSFPGSTNFEPRLHAATAPLAQGHEAVCLFVNDDASRPVLEILAQCGVRFVAMRCAGYDKVDLQAAADLGISVARVPSYSPHSVAEQAVALLLCLNRNLHHAYNRVRSGDYSLSGLVGYEVRSKTIGVMGTGGIGTAAVSIFKGFGARVLAFDLQPSPEVEAMGVQYVSKEHLLQNSDIISLHLPLTSSTAHMLDATSLASLKPGAVVVNVSRGGLIDTDAAMDALESGQLGGLAMDVYEREGALFFTDFSRGSREQKRQGWDRKLALLMSSPNVLVSPHSAFLTQEALDNIATTTIQNLKEFAVGSSLSNQVSLK